MTLRELLDELGIMSIPAHLDMLDYEMFIGTEIEDIKIYDNYLIDGNEKQLILFLEERDAKTIYNK